MGWLIDLVKDFCHGCRKWSNMPDSIDELKKAISHFDVLVFGLEDKQNKQGERISRLEGIVINGKK